MRKFLCLIPLIALSWSAHAQNIIYDISASWLATQSDISTLKAQQVQSDWNQTNSSLLDFIKNKPSITGQVNADWNASTGVAQILNKPTFPNLPSQTATTRSFNSAFQISSTRPVFAFYSVQCTITASIAGGQNCDVIFEIASDSGFTTNVQTVSICGDGQTYTLAVALQGVQPTTKMCGGFVPIAYYARLRTVQNTGAPSFSYRAGQEILF